VANLLLIVAAGSGTRLGRAEPKALVALASRPLLSWTLASLAPAGFARTVVAAPPERLEDFRRAAGDAVSVVAGGATRSASVRAGFAALAAEAEDVVAVHDAARPLVTAEEAQEVVAAAERTGAAIAAIPVVDTIKLVHENRIVRTVDRSSLWAAATPQAFRGKVLRRALESGWEATDEASLCEDLGIPVAVVPVSRLGFKITTPADLELAEAVLCARGRSGDGMGSRVGIGFDAHPFTKGRPLCLGGVAIPHDAGLEGHSDGDALLHALTDAILGAAGLGSIGDYFPSTDLAWRGADSAAFLRKAAELVAASGFAIGNVDVLVIAEAPKLAPYVPAIRDRLAGILGIPRERLSIRGTSSNGLGFIGRGEGLVAMASVLLTAS
jgi:2-C-methyl-D-erythritol 4-phosphate cytidylyltransferase/2-C-methyl-D-erythritol 2,4-cyclodiphosphate synthase